MKPWAWTVCLLAGCATWQDPLQSDALLEEALENIPNAPPFICPEPDWGALSFAQSIATGLCHHPDTRAAYAEMESRSATWGYAQAAYLPTLSASYRREHAQSGASYANASNTQNPGRLLAELQWTLFDFGERAANREQSTHLLRLSAASYHRQLQNRWANIARHFVSAAIARQKALIAADHEAVAAQILDSAQTFTRQVLALAQMFKKH